MKFETQNYCDNTDVEKLCCNYRWFVYFLLKLIPNLMFLLC
jgi:hypothetical protein